MFTLLPAPLVMVGLAGHLKRNPLQDPGTITPVMRQAARAVYGAVQREHGFSGTGTNALLTAPGANVKIAKSERAVWSLTLAPAASSGLINTCVRYADCHDVCVLTSGKGGVPAVQRSRAARTALLYRSPDAFAVLLADEIDRAARAAKKGGNRWGMRLNAASDIAWEHAAPWVLDRISALGGVTYDYTKAWSRVDTPGYTLVRSVDSRQDTARIAATVNAGQNVAVVLPVKKGAPVPATWNGLPTVDGDISDDRSEDPRGVVVVLRAKGTLRNRPGHALVRAL